MKQAKSEMLIRYKEKQGILSLSGTRQSPWGCCWNLEQNKSHGRKQYAEKVRNGIHVTVTNGTRSATVCFDHLTQMLSFQQHIKSIFFCEAKYIFQGYGVEKNLIGTRAINSQHMACGFYSYGTVHNPKFFLSVGLIELTGV